MSLLNILAMCTIFLCIFFSLSYFIKNNFCSLCPSVWKILKFTQSLIPSCVDLGFAVILFTVLYKYYSVLCSFKQKGDNKVVALCGTKFVMLMPKCLKNSKIYSKSDSKLCGFWFCCYTIYRTIHYFTVSRAPSNKGELTKCTLWY